VREEVRRVVGAALLGQKLDSQPAPKRSAKGLSPEREKALLKALKQATALLRQSPSTSTPAKSVQRTEGLTPIEGPVPDGVKYTFGPDGKRYLVP
jgi:hypothetical protein